GVNKLLVAFDVLAGRDYFLRVAGDGLEAGAYDLEVRTSFAGGFDDAFPVRLSPEGFPSQLGSIVASGAGNAFRFGAPIAGRMTARETATLGSHLDGFLYVFDAGQDLVASDDNSGGALNSLVGFRVVAGATYYVVVSGVGATIGGYSLSLGADDA